jgi:hypothetical protein
MKTMEGRTKLFPLNGDLRYKLTKRAKVIAAGEGKTVITSSKSIAVSRH